MRILIAMLLLAPASAFGFMVIETDVSQPYEIVPIEVSMPEQLSFLGTLDDFPVMYEITSDQPFTFTAKVAKPAGTEPVPYSMLLIRRNDRGGGVTEMTRLPYDASSWTTVRNSLLGMSFTESPVLEQAVAAGTYRLEVSSPDNIGQFLLTVGTEPAKVGYFKQLGMIRQTQAYFGNGVFAMLKSSFVYYPIGIILLLGAFFQTYRLARKQTKPINNA